MQIHPTEIPGLVTLTLDVHRDERGFFAETWRAQWSEALGLPGTFVQANHARSEIKGVLRGLHFQVPPAAQSKLVWVTRGAVYDVAVDLRTGSPTYGRHHGILLSEENRLRFFLPRGFAHGYLCLEPGTEFHYLVDSYYSPEHEGGIAHDDPDLNIAWPDTSGMTLSSRDKALPSFADLQSPFVFV